MTLNKVDMQVIDDKLLVDAILDAKVRVCVCVSLSPPPPLPLSLSLVPSLFLCRLKMC